MHLSLQHNVEAIDNIFDFVDVLSFLDPDVLNPMTDFDENSKIPGDAGKVRFIF